LKSKYLYLAIDVLTILVPLIASFYPKSPFYKKWKYLLPAIILPAIIFLVWDEIFTQHDVWGFNEEYLTGIFIGTLPLEEVLFFICIPYACVFTYFTLNYLIEKDHLFPHHELISSALIVTLLVVGARHMEKWYTGLTFISLGLLLAYVVLRLRPRYMGRFYFAFVVILFPFFIVNGILTGSWIDGEVVWYSNVHNLSLRLGTIPVEDVFYGMLLMLMNIIIFEWLQERERLRNR
jgi:lycopene cyclase domain-containing protein